MTLNSPRINSARRRRSHFSTALTFTFARSASICSNIRGGATARAGGGVGLGRALARCYTRCIRGTGGKQQCRLTWGSSSPSRKGSRSGGRLTRRATEHRCCATACMNLRAIPSAVARRAPIHWAGSADERRLANSNGQRLLYGRNPPGLTANQSCPRQRRSEVEAVPVTPACSNEPSPV